MPQIIRTALVPYSVEQMYQLVNDVQSYPKFLPGCIGSQVLESSFTKTKAKVKISIAGINKTFTTYNTLITNQSILIHLVDGPFKSLMGEWKFIPFGKKSCHIKFYLDFKFANKLIELTFHRLFKNLIYNIIISFIDRAEKIYNFDK